VIPFRFSQKQTLPFPEKTCKLQFHERRKIMTPERLKRLAVFFAAFIVLLVWSVPLEAQGRGGKSCLFKVTSASSTVYLLGSIHFMREASYPLKDTIEKAFAVSPNVVFEVNMAEMDSPDTQAMMLSKSVFTDGNTLEKSLSPAVYRNLGEKAGEFGLDTKMLDSFKPWSVAMTLIGLKLNQLGFDPAQGIDHYFHAKAQAAGKRTFSLETMSYQIGLFDSLSRREQEYLVEQTLNDFDTMESEMGEMLRSWTNGDIGNLERMLLKSFVDYPGLYQTFLVRRNRNWLSQIEAFLGRQKSCFVVVGAGHLLGPDGLVNLLRRKGYLVEQL
jgi:uncharacterized protein